MKILVISNCYSNIPKSDYDARCYDTLEALRKRDHSIDILTVEQDTDEPQEGEEHVVRRLKLEVTDVHRKPSLFESHETERNNKNALKEEINRLQPDVIYTWNLKGLTHGLFNYLQKLKHAVVFDVSDFWLIDTWEEESIFAWLGGPRQSRSRQSNLSHWSARISHPFVDTHNPHRRICYCSKYIKKLTENHGCVFDKTKIVHPFINAEKFDKKLDYGQTNKILWVGNLSEKDNAELALEGFKLFIATNKESSLHFHVDGDRESRTALTALIERKGLKRKAFVHEFKIEEEDSLYAQYDVLLISGGENNPFPTYAAKAMAARLPVIAAAEGSITEIVKDDFNGLTFKPNNPIELSRQLVTWSQLPDKGAIFGRNGSDYTKRALSKHTVINQIEDILSQSAVLNVEHI